MSSVSIAQQGFQEINEFCSGPSQDLGGEIVCERGNLLERVPEMQLILQAWSCSSFSVLTVWNRKQFSLAQRQGRKGNNCVNVLSTNCACYGTALDILYRKIHGVSDSKHRMPGCHWDCYPEAASELICDSSPQLSLHESKSQVSEGLFA